MLQGGKDQIAGVLQLSAPSDFGRNLLLPWLDEFQARYPQLSLRLLLGDRVTDLYRQPVDVAIRYGAPADSSLVALPLAPDNRRVLCAAPGYLAERGEPRQPDDLREHNCLLYQLGGRVHDRWAFQRGRRSLTLTVAGDRVCDDADVVRRWALAGKGLVYKSWLDVAEDVRAGRLRLLLPEWQGEATPMNLLCTHRAQLTRPVTLLRAFGARALRRIAGGGSMDEELNRAGEPGHRAGGRGQAPRACTNACARPLALPPWYGCNWDAFWDAISGLVPMPRRLRLQGWSDFARRLPEEAAQLSACLEALRETYPQLAPEVLRDA
ncbi:LysR family transcriptional regulator [Pseudomonas aeruginosa]|nr:LysR family transcriptional regulator [Pseudomonas aeruginosa]